VKYTTLSLKNECQGLNKKKSIIIYNGLLNLKFYMPTIYLGLKYNKDFPANQEF